MNRLHRCISALMFVFTSVFLSCEKLEIPNDRYDDGNDNFANKGNGSSEAEDGEEAPQVHALSVCDIINGKYTTTEDVYVEGYIVGYVKTSSMDFCRFSRGDVETNILIADTPIDTVATKCIPVQLTNANNSCKATRTALNLAKNNVLGQKVRLQGDIDSYMGTTGILKARKHTFLENDFDRNAYEEDNRDKDGDNSQDAEDEEPEDTITPEEQEWEDLKRYFYSHGTADAPFTVTDFKTVIPKFLSKWGAPEIGAPGLSDVYACGYIVGYVKGANIKQTVFGIDKAVETNIVIADSPDETDYNNCIAVQLSTTSDRHRQAREALNLANHPENYKKQFILFGNITDSNGYMGARGLVSVKAYTPLTSSCSASLSAE